MNIPILRTSKILGNDNRLEIDADVDVKGVIRANSLTVNDQPLGDIINNTVIDAAATAAAANKLYTWIMYSEFYDGANMTDKPTINSNYIGFSYNQPTEKKGTNPKLYTWTLIKGKSAVQYYTWMKYATGPNGEGINDSPIDDTYIYLGLAYNQLGMTESSDPKDYTWTKFIGPQGVTGPNGYTWVKYAPNNNPTATEMTDDPVGMNYIGMSYNNVGMTESGNPDDYKPWLLFKGPTGLPGEVGATGSQGPATYTWMKYATGPSGEGFNDTPIDDTYIYMGLAYNKPTQKESDDPKDYLWTKFIGPTGIPGNPTYTWMKYATGPSGEGFNDSPIDDTYIYIGLAYNKTDSKEGTNPSEYTWTKFIGPQGVTGPNGYTWIKYARDVHGTGLTDNPLGMDYIGIAYNKASEKESDDPSEYRWSLYKGPTGVDGPTLYTWIKYAKDDHGTGLTDSPLGMDYVGMAYNKPGPTESTDPSDYVWALYKGSDGVDGPTLYTWMKYATGPSGEGINDSPIDDTYIYIGLAYNQLGMTESSDPSDYKWTKFIGPQGVTGPNGYTWIKYARDVHGTGLTDNPLGMDYIGIAYNKASEKESDDPSEYRWSLYKGPTGVDGPTLYTWIKYATGPSGEGFNDSPINDTYIYIGMAYNKTSLTESDDPKDYVWTKFIGPQGVKGSPTYTWMKYATGPNGEGLNDTPIDNTYIYIGLAYNKDSQYESDDPKDYVWTKFIGPQGVEGPKGPNGLTTYTWIKYARDVHGTGLTDNPVGMDYIGIAYNKTSQDESDDPSEYRWSLYKGPTGVDGATLYTWIKYAKDDHGTGLTDSPLGMDYIGLAYNKTSPDESDDPSAYVWSLYKGTDGLRGPAGTASVSVVMSASNFTFTTDFDGTISSPTYAQASSSITVLDGVDVVYYTHSINGSFDPRYTYKLHDNVGSFTAIINDTHDLGELSIQTAYGLLNSGEWLLYSIEGTAIQLSDYNMGIIPSTNRDYATTVAPTNMSADMASLKFTIIGKTYAGATFSFKQGQTFSKASVGPGIVYRGPFNAGTAYYASAKRRDVVYNTSSSNYWTASNLSKNGLKTWEAPSSNNSDWTVFAAEFSSIATGVIISEESYVKNTLNVGTNASGSAGNITLYGGNQYPFISLGQSTMGYGNPGFWLGSTSASGSYLLSIGNTNNYLTWTGSELQIKGAIDITSSSTIASITDLDNATTAANSYADTAASNAANNIVIGGRNLIPNSLFNIDFNDYGGHGRTVNLTQGVEYTFSANGNNANALNNKVLWVILFKPDWTFQQRLIFDSSTNLTKSTTFTAPSTGNFSIDSYYADSSDPRTGSVRLNWCKLEVGNRATDWTPAPEDIDESISAAKTSADNANALLADIASDSKLTPNEKNATLKEWNTILAEKPIISEQANSVGLIPDFDYTGYNERDQYEYCYNGLYTYITPLLASMSTTSNINGTAFRTAFSNYYTAKTSILTAISSKMSTPALNLLPNGSQFQYSSLLNWVSNGSTLIIDTIVKYNNYNTFKITGSGGAYNNTDVRLDPSTIYTYSAFVKCSEDFGGSPEQLLHIQNWTDTDKSNVHQETVQSYNQSLVANTWKLVYVIFKTPASTTQIHSRFYFYPMTQTMSLNIYYVKLEKGNRPTPISIAGDSAVTLLPTDITGKLVKTPNPSKAGLYLGDTHLGYYNGSSWVTYMDNTGRFGLTGSNGNSLIWNGNTLSIAGDVTATTGYLGGTAGWKIDSNGIISADGGIELNGNGISAAGNYIKLYDRIGDLRFWAYGATALPTLTIQQVLKYFPTGTFSITSSNGVIGTTSYYDANSNSFSSVYDTVKYSVSDLTVNDSGIYNISYNMSDTGTKNIFASTPGSAINVECYIEIVDQHGLVLGKSISVSNQAYGSYTVYNSQGQLNMVTDPNTNKQVPTAIYISESVNLPNTIFKCSAALEYNHTYLINLVCEYALYTSTYDWEISNWQRSIDRLHMQVANPNPGNGDPDYLDVVFPSYTSSAGLTFNIAGDQGTQNQAINLIKSNTGLVVNGGGIRATLDTNNYLEVSTGMYNWDGIGCSTKIAGTAMFLNGAVSLVSEVLGYPAAIKAWGNSAWDTFNCTSSWNGNSNQLYVTLSSGYTFESSTAYYVVATCSTNDSNTVKAGAAAVVQLSGSQFVIRTYDYTNAIARYDVSWIVIAK